MSKQNLLYNDSNENITDASIKNESSNTEELINQISSKLLDHEINIELEELKNQVHLEIEKRKQSNLKHNILHVTPRKESIKEENNLKLNLFKEKNASISNSNISFENVSDNKYNIENNNEMENILKPLLQNKLIISKEIHKLTCVEDILKCKIKFRENLDSIAFDLNANYKNTEDNNICFYHQQWRKVVSELNKLKNLGISLDLNIQSLMLDMNISPDNNDILYHTIDLKTCQCEFQAEHIKHIKEVFREEINVKDKFIHIMAQMLNMYNNVLLRNSLLTKQMSNSYSNMIRTAKKLGIKNLLKTKISNSKNQKTNTKNPDVNI